MCFVLCAFPTLAFHPIDSGTVSTIEVRRDKERKDMWINMSDSGRENDKAEAANAGMREKMREIPIATKTAGTTAALQTPASSAHVSSASVSPNVSESNLQTINPTHTTPVQTHRRRIAVGRPDIPIKSPVIALLLPRWLRDLSFNVSGRC